MRGWALLGWLLAFLALAPLAPAQAAAAPGYVTVYQHDVNGTVYTVAVAPGGAVIANDTNATLVLVAAVAYAGGNGLSVRVGPGVYVLHRAGSTPGPYGYPYAVWVNATGVHVYADPQAIFVIRDDASIVLGSDAYPVEDVGWHGGVVVVEANYTTTRGAIIVMQASGFVVEDVVIRGAPAHGIHVLMGSSDGRIAHNTITNATLQAIVLDGADDVAVVGNTIRHARVGIGAQVNSDYEASGGDGVPERCAVAGNTIYDVATGVAVMGGVGFTITGNTIHVDISAAAETYGVKLGAYSTSVGVWAPHHNAVVGNTITGARYAIFVSGYPGAANATYNIITGNAVYDTVYYLVLKYAARNTVGANAVDAQNDTIIMVDAVENYVAAWNPYAAMADVVIPEPTPPTVTITTTKTVTATSTATKTVAQPAAPEPSEPGEGGAPGLAVLAGIGAAAILVFLLARK